MLEGLPCSAEQVQLMAAKDVLPQYVFNIKAEYSEPRIQEAFQKQEAVPMKTCSFVNHLKEPFSETTSVEYSAVNFECLKELGEKSISVATVNWVPSQLSILTKVLQTLDIFVPQACKHIFWLIPTALIFHFSTIENNWISANFWCHQRLLPCNYEEK